ncbi:MAG: hypothetical protein Q9220_004656 [cf. Caloplaca sp. 1 TL-2023]
MAFQQPVLASSRPPHVEPRPNEQTAQPFPTLQTQPERPQEWVLFPTTGPRRSADTQTASTGCTLQTADFSRLSECGGSQSFGAHYDCINEHDGVFEGDAELDSLDEGLHAFQEHTYNQDVSHVDPFGSVLPTHDGLGDFPASGFSLQDRLWHFERFNPQRRSSGHHRRRSSVQRKLDALEQDDGLRIEEERMNRIEKWRVEHSRILLQEVEKASRRQSFRQSELSKAATPVTDVRTSTSTSNHSITASISEPNPTRLPQAEISHVENNESVWHGIVRRLVQDLIDVDSNTLCLIFGEALPLDEASLAVDNTAPFRGQVEQDLVHQSDLKINVTLLGRLSQQLTSMLRRLSYTPAAIGSLVNPLTLEYGGIPVTQPPVTQVPASALPERDVIEPEDETTTLPIFNPTLADRPTSADSDFGHAALWGIEEEPVNAAPVPDDHEYWEQTPSIKTFFRLLHQHFVSRRRPLLTPSISHSNKASNVATTSTSDSLRRAAMIRQHHPLMARPHARRAAATTRHHGAHSVSSPLFKRSETSCASVSARKSRRGSGSSRNYWDFRSSIASGSIGGIGVWGEV